MSDCERTAVFTCGIPGYAVYLLSEDSFSVIIGDNMYNSVSCRVDRGARRITAKCHIWEYDFLCRL
jgi:hypothetical protein